MLSCTHIAEMYRHQTADTDRGTTLHTQTGRARQPHCHGEAPRALDWQNFSATHICVRVPASRSLGNKKLHSLAQSYLQTYRTRHIETWHHTLRSHYCVPSFPCMFTATHTQFHV